MSRTRCTLRPVPRADSTIAPMLQCACVHVCVLCVCVCVRVCSSAQTITCYTGTNTKAVLVVTSPLWHPPAYLGRWPPGKMCSRMKSLLRQ